MIKIGKSYLKNCSIKFYGTDNKIFISDMCIIRGLSILINGCHNKVIIGKNNMFNNLTICTEDPSNTIIIGNNNCISGSLHIDCIESTSVNINDFCLFSANIYIRTGDSHSVIDANTGLRVNPSKNIRLNNHIWVGQDCVILKGVSIKENSIIALGSVVTKSPIESNVVVAGNPATIVKHNIDWSFNRILNSTNNL